jgi:hypothetical protein
MSDEKTHEEKVKALEDELDRLIDEENRRIVHRRLLPQQPRPKKHRRRAD